jgi:hypothetical protein
MRFELPSGSALPTEDFAKMISRETEQERGLAQPEEGGQVIYEGNRLSV